MLAIHLLNIKKFTIMSTLSISLQTLADVRHTLASHNFVLDNLVPGALSILKKKEYAHDAAKRFVELALIFNYTEYFKGEQAKSNAEPKEWGDAVRALNLTHGKKMTDFQLLKSLDCIEYNTAVECYLNTEEYMRWSRRWEFEDFHTVIRGMREVLMTRIVSHLPEYENAKWG